MKNMSRRNIQISHGAIIYTTDSSRQINIESDVRSALFKEQSFINMLPHLHTWLRACRESRGRDATHATLEVWETQVPEGSQPNIYFHVVSYVKPMLLCAGTFHECLSFWRITSQGQHFGSFLQIGKQVCLHPCPQASAFEHLVHIVQPFRYRT